MHTSRPIKTASDKSKSFLTSHLHQLTRFTINKNPHFFNSESVGYNLNSTK